jgi:histidinol-phosphate phosphatase family protein
MLELTNVDREWTLFLDRDGVINYQIEGDYVRSWEDFRFYEGVLEAMPVLSRRFGRILVVTNQKGVGKGLMSEADLRHIHNHMCARIEALGGRIDRIYHCPDIDPESPCRKPNPGMGLAAARDYPDLHFNKAIMVGNTLADMQFGKSLGARTIFIASTEKAPALPHPLVDAVFQDLSALAKAL